MSSSALGKADEATGKLTRLMGHDLRNNLCVMQNSVYFLTMKLGRENDKVSKHLDILAREIAMSSQTVADLMDLVAPKQPNRITVDINELLHKVILQNPVPETLKARLTLAQVLPPLEADSEQIGRAIQNILLYQYSTLKPGDALHISSLACASGVRVEFLDSSPGLSRDELEHLMDVRLADRPSPVRIGLTVAQQLITLNSGRLEVESRAGIGMRFDMILPRG